MTPIPPNAAIKPIFGSLPTPLSNSSSDFVHAAALTSLEAGKQDNKRLQEDDSLKRKKATDSLAIIYKDLLEAENLSVEGLLNHPAFVEEKVLLTALMDRGSITKEALSQVLGFPNALNLSLLRTLCLMGKIIQIPGHGVLYQKKSDDTLSFTITEDNKCFVGLKRIKEGSSKVINAAVLLSEPQKAYVKAKDRYLYLEKENNLLKALEVAAKTKNEKNYFISPLEFIDLSQAKVQIGYGKKYTGDGEFLYKASLPNRFIACYSVAKALSQLHELNMIHMDLHDGNILYEGDLKGSAPLEIRVFDLGISQKSGEELKKDIIVPEEVEVVSCHIDEWDLGVFILHLFIPNFEEFKNGLINDLADTNDEVEKNKTVAEFQALVKKKLEKIFLHLPEETKVHIPSFIESVLGLVAINPDSRLSAYAAAQAFKKMRDSAWSARTFVD